MSKLFETLGRQADSVIGSTMAAAVTVVKEAQAVLGPILPAPLKADMAVAETVAETVETAVDAAPAPAPVPVASDGTTDIRHAVS